MTIQTVLENIIWTGYTGDEGFIDQTRIIVALTQLYSVSEHARDILDKITPSKKLTIQFEADHFEADTGQFKIYIDPTMEQDYYISPNGRAVEWPLSVSIAHELVHAIEGLSDNPQIAPNFAGPVVEMTNLIHDDFEIPHRLSYKGAGVAPQLEGGKEYTNGLQIDTAIVLNFSENNQPVNNYDVTSNGHIAGSRDLLIGNSANNVIFSGNGNDFLYGNGGNDSLEGGTGNDFIDGGEGNDTAFYDGTTVVNINVRASSSGSSNPGTIEIDGGAGNIDHIKNIEKVELNALNNTITVTRNPNIPYPSNVMIDGGDGIDTLQYAGTNVVTSIKEITAPNEADSNGLKMELIGNIENIIGTGGDDKLNIGLLANTKVTSINAGDGVDHVWVFGSLVGSNPTIDLGDKDDFLHAAPRGSIVYGGTGKDTFELGSDYLIGDAAVEDKITYQGKQIYGGVTWKGQESPWAKGLYGIKYALSDNGSELVIKNLSGKDTYLAGFFDQLSGQTAGIRIGEISMESYRLRDTPKNWQIYETYEAIFGYYLKIMTGTSYFAGVDPLVLDLDADGIELSARSSVSPFYDVDADGFAEKTGWVRGDDAILVRDLNANGKIDNVGEMFGNASTTGFSALATLDSNADGKISSLDSAFSTLKLWRDLDGDGVTDAGELQTLSAASIASISLANASTIQNIAGNIVTATGTFTRANGTTGAVGDVALRANQRDTDWLGDKTIDSASAALPELKGFGTLTDLRIAMTDSAALKSAVTTALTQLGSLSLSSMRSALTPVLNAWMAAVPVPAGNPGTVAHVDVPILSQVTSSGAVVNDFAYKVTDIQGSYWKLASGDAVKNAQGVVIARPTITEVLAQTSTQGTWTTFNGQQIQFLERYLGTELPIGNENNLSGAAVVDAAQGLLNEMWRTLNDVAVKLAIQGPLASYFPGIIYNSVTDKFEATTAQQIAPAIQAIFSAAPTNTSGALAHLATWKPIIDVFLGSFDRGGNLEISYGFLMKNIVAAYENVSLATSLVQAADAFGIPADLIKTGTGTINGSDDADLFYLGTGNQNVHGGVGPDTYIVGRNFGSDTIDGTNDAPSGSPDTVRFAHLNSNQVTMVRDGIDLIITEVGTSNSIRIIGQFARQNYSLPIFNLISYAIPNHGVEEIIFAGGQVWDRLDIAKAVSTNTAGNDIINGTDTIDFLDGGLGNDTLNGGIEGDVYIFGAGYGQDVVYDNIGIITIDSPDIVQFKAGITLDMVSFTRQGDSKDLVIKINGTSEQLTIKDQFYALYPGIYSTQWVSRIEGFVFDDGTNISWDQVFDMVISSAETSGNDTIYGFSRTDTFIGGAGNDFYSGGEEGDLYTLGFGYGNDIISDQRTNLYSGNNDTLQFLDGINPEDLVLSRTGGNGVPYDLKITIPDGSNVTIKDQFNLLPVFGMDTGRIEYFTFKNGTQWDYNYMKQVVLERSITSGNDTIYGYLETNDTINGGDGDDTINGLSGNDVIIGGKGNDTLVNNTSLYETGDTTYIHNLGDGVDTIIEGYFSGNDTLQLTGAGLTSTNVIFQAIFDYNSPFNNSAILSFNGLSDQIILKDEFGPYGAGVEYIQFSDGVVWNKQTLQLQYLSNASTNGNDYIYGFAGNDTITGGLGDDTMDGLGGDDIYIHNQGDGIDTIGDQIFSGNDTVKLFGAALTSTNVIISRPVTELDNIIIGFNGVSDKVINKGVFANLVAGAENIIFSNGVTWGIQDFKNRYLSDVSTSGNDTIYGFAGNDIITGGVGDDYMNGLGGNDLYFYNEGDGNDTVSDYEGNQDTLQLNGAGLISTNAVIYRDGASNTVTLGFNGVSGSIKLGGLFERHDSQVDRIIFSNSVIWDRDDIRLAYINNIQTSGNDNIYGFNAAETITGGLGDDYMEGLGGNDLYIYREGDGNDVITESYNGDMGFDTLPLLGANLTSDKAIVTRPAGEYTHAILGFVGVSGTIKLNNQFGGNGVPIENIIFSDGVVWDLADLQARYLQGAATNGNDIIYGFEYFNDNIEGGSGDDTIDGLGGDDILRGLSGDDTYIHTQAQGNDTIEEGYLGGFDSLQLNGSALKKDNFYLTVGTNPATAVFNFSGITDKIYIANQLDPNPVYGLEKFIFSDGEILLRSDLVTGTSSNDIALNGNSNDNVMFGFAGNDILNGNDGNDIIIGGTGGDTINGGNGIDTVSYLDSASLVNVSLMRTGVQFGGSATNDILSNIENIIGSFSNDTLTGNASNNIITGGLGSDTIDGGAGIDTVSYKDSAVAVAVNLALTTAQSGGTAQGDSLSNIENIIGSSNNDTLTGSAVANAIDGGAGNDTINGGVGDDTVTGGAGVDVFVINKDAGSSDIITDFSTSTVGEYISLLGFTNSVNFSNLNIAQNGANTVITLENGQTLTLLNVTASTLSPASFGQTGPINGTSGNDVLNGTAGADIINALAGNDIINGSAGADTIDGGADIDTMSYAASASGVTVNLQTNVNTGGDAAGDSLSNIENVTGSGYNDILTALATGSVLTGGAGVDNLNGGVGNDTLIGGTGGDIINGGAGIDTVSYIDSTGIVNVDLTRAGVQFGGSAIDDILSNIENLTGSNYNDSLYGNTIDNIIRGGLGNDYIFANDGNDTLYGEDGDDNISGDNGNDTIQGDAGNDIIAGGSGVDSLSGGDGNDVLTGGLGGDTINGGNGSDTVSYADSASLVDVNLTRTGVQFGGSATDDILSNIEHIIGSAYPDKLAGNAVANTIDGGAGTDTMSYFASTSAVTVDLSLATAQSGGFAAGDILINIENLTGSMYNDILTGNTGNNILTGSTGKDTLTGGTGADTFRYTATTDSTSVAGTRDIITDFNISQADKIDLSAFAGTFSFKGTGAFTGTANEVNYAQVSGNTIIGVDADGNGALDFQIELTGLHTLTSSDFLL